MCRIPRQDLKYGLGGTADRRFDPNHLETIQQSIEEDQYYQHEHGYIARERLHYILIVLRYLGIVLVGKGCIELLRLPKMSLAGRHGRFLSRRQTDQQDKQSMIFDLHWVALSQVGSLHI